jgi:hypothetical protein
MYNTKIFDTFYNLTEFLNDNNILPSNIISISTFSRGVALVYFD